MLQLKVKGKDRGRKVTWKQQKIKVRKIKIKQKIKIRKTLSTVPPSKSLGELIF